MQRLPVNILRRIFTSLLDLHTPGPQRRGALLSFVQVRRAWRDLAYANPHLWATLHIRVDAKHPNVNALTVSTWLKRSRFVPLHITIVNENQGAWDVNEALSLLAPHFSRLQSLTCQLNKSDTQRVLDASGPAGFSNLCRLVLNRARYYTSTAAPISITLSHFPKLSSVHSEHGMADFTFILKKEDPPYALEVVEGGLRASLNGCLDIIRNSSSLMELDAVCLDESPIPRLDSPIVHPVLTDLHVMLFDGDELIRQFFDSITLPSLESFGLSFENRRRVQWSKCLPQFLKRSSPPLEDLHVEGCHGRTMVQSLRYVPTLTRLSSILDGSFASRLTLCGSPSDLVPKLENVYLRYNDGLYWSARENLFDLISSRWGGPSGDRPGEGRLKTLELEMGSDDDEYEALMDGLEPYMEEGLQFG